ncbi:hypothetical protein CC85DRAFT_284275 [Cutaneotrichosporon oleaginosum]|uniref:ubiquitinyl hydrolase 1 n=1 Tax=Cutaneotrichosporon oleaginosum TaxID=879819 RepID=A0A0J0XRQ7_9TREE|nr:uncharacterized protein CC85DRAFT_284275 [Cutaneotrichosporon oleaginosum]KLT43767.1 hypothetical protein CC85DRAFT_284275 [Cutaneotrichosporon oleaginosum]TXT05183.1 hypothetical protein COLE_06503 [Cutaneotrichosporon oleaginosum]
MPPKKYQKDWSWCNLIDSSEEITLEHCRLAAGLHPSISPKACPLPSPARNRPKSKSPVTSKDLRNCHGKRAISIDSNSSDSSTDKSVVALDKKGDCQAKRCHNNPRCFSHLGMEEWWKDHARESFIKPRMGVELRERNDSGPPGLRNYGATCYANAFLQVWFHNVSFRNGVFEAVGDRVNPLFHLAKIFAAMRYTRRSVVDPGALIEALRLNKGAQQDAAEFSKLFMDLIEKQFKAQGGLLAGFVAEQFAGRLEYRTKCNTCGYTSSNTSPFMELEIPLRDGCSLEGQLRAMLAPELLDGDNKYRCPNCDSLQPASRSTHLQHLPLALHFALNRFEYTLTSDERKKSKARIYYPRKLRLENIDYDLHGVVVHQGTMAIHGHFTAEVYDENDKEWYFCSDGEVSKLSERTTKKIKLDPDFPDDQVSRDAYMLVYQRRRNPPPQRHAPEHMRREIELDNDEFTGAIAAQFDRSDLLGDAFDVLVKEKEAVLKLLPGDDCVVSRAALAGWFASDKLKTKWFVPNNMRCHHGRYDPNASGFRLVSRAALARLKAFYDGEWDHLASEYPTINPAAFEVLKEFQTDVQKEKTSAPAHENGGQPEFSTESRASFTTSTVGSDKENEPPAEERDGYTTPDEEAQSSSKTLQAEDDHTTPTVNGSAPQPACSYPHRPSSPDPLALNGATSGSTHGSEMSVATEPQPSTSSSMNWGSPPGSVAGPSGGAPEENSNASDSDDDVHCLSPPPDFPEFDICIQCVTEEYERKAGDTRQAELLDEFKRANERGGQYLLPRAWTTAWAKNKLSPGVPPTDPEYTIFCKHDRPFPGDKKVDCVSEEAILILRSVLGEFPVFDEAANQCEECCAAQEVSNNERAAWLARVKDEEKLYKNNRNQSQVFGTRNYLLPQSFFEQWETYLKGPVERPTLQLDLCPHGLLDFDPGLDKAEYINSYGWEQLCELYNFPVEDGVSVEYDAQPAKGKRIAMHKASLATCGPCRAERFSDWKEMWLPIVVGENEGPTSNDWTRRRPPPRGRRGKEAQILVTKRTSIVEVQMELYEMFKITPFSQRLTHHGRELDRQETIGGIGVLMGDHFNLHEVVEVDNDFGMIVEEGEGFGGTALVGQKSCEHCTMFNDPGAAECQMCGLPFTA